MDADLKIIQIGKIYENVAPGGGFTVYIALCGWS